MSKKVMISAGETSGELYGALLSREIIKLWPDAQIFGIGGARMKAEGVTLIALFVLQRTLQKGTSIGMLQDQSTMKGLLVNFFGRPATTTPVPAILAVTYKRPVVVVAACRKENNKYEGFVSEPIWPAEGYKSEKEEIFRITQEITRNMESIIRKYPEQYLWMHNRWKTYKGKKEIMS